MMCAECLEKMASDHWIVVKEMEHDVVATKIRLCSTICLVRWYA